MAAPKGGAPRPLTGSGGSPSNGFSGPSGGATYGPQGQKQPISWDDDDIRRRMRIVGKLYPGLKKKPKLLMSLAQQDIPDDHLVESVTKTAGFNVVQQQAKMMKKAPDDQQRATWDGMNKTVRQMMKQAGYEGPPGKPGIFEQAFDAVTKLPVLRSTRAFVEGRWKEGFNDLPMLPSIPEKGKKPGVIEGAIESTKSQMGLDAFEQTKEAIGGGADILGQVGGGGLRKAGLEGVAGFAHDVSQGAEDYVVSPLLRLQNTAGGAARQFYRLDQELAGHAGGPAGGPIAPIDWSDPFKMPEINKPFFEDNAIGGATKAGIGLLTGDEKDVKHFLDAWEKTAVGERYFPDRVVYQAEDILDGDPYSLEAAKQIAGGSTIEDIAKRYGDVGTQKYQDEYLHLSGLVGTATFEKAVHALEVGKVSPGRDLARGVGLAPDSGAGMFLSGATDAVVAWYTDPLLFAGKMRQAYKAREAIATAEGIADAASTGRAKVVDALGSDWEAKVQSGEVSINQVTKVDKRFGTAAQMAKLFTDARSGVAAKDAFYDFFHRQFPQFEKAEKSLIDHHNDLVYENTEALVKKLGRGLTAEEAAAVPGIKSADDIWAFYNTLEGRTRFASASWQPGAVGNFYLPGLTRTQRNLGQLRSVMTRQVEDLAERGMTGGFGKQEVIFGVEGMKEAAAAEPELAEGYTRLYRVQGGGGLLSYSRHGREAEQLRWFDNIEQARKGGLGLGKLGQFGYVDVSPDDLAKAKKITDNGLDHIDDMNEYIMADDFLANPKVLGPVGEWAEIDGKAAPALRGMLAMPARLAQSLMAQVPTGTVNYWGHETPTQVARLLDMEYGSAVKGELYDQIMLANSPIVRQEMIRSVLDRIGYANGVYVDEAGKAAMERFINGVGKRYALDDKDKVPVGTNRVPMGIAPYSDHADQFAMPDWKLVGQHSRRMGVLNTLMGPSQAPMWDAVIGKAWKPAMLFRLGFAPRAAAEEAIVTLLRAPHVYTEGALLRMAKAGGEPVVTYRDVARRAKGMSVYIPGHVADDALMHPLEKLAHYLPNWSRNAMRGMADMAIDPQTLHGSRIMAENPEILSAVAAEMTRVGSIRPNWSLAEDVMGGVVEPSTMSIATSADQSTPPLQMRTGESEFVTATGADPAKAPYFVHGAERWIKDPVQREMMRARNLYVDEMQADALAAPLIKRGVVPDANARDANYDVVRQAMAAVASDPEFKQVYREYLDVKRLTEHADEAEKLHARLNDIAVASGDRTLMAIADSAHKFQQEIEFVPLINRNEVLRQLHRPEPEIAAIDRELFGPHLVTNEEDFYDKILNELPDVEPGLTRVFGRGGSREEEQSAAATIGRSFTDLAEEQQPWKYVTTDPNEVITRVMDDVNRAKRSEPVYTRNLFYADVPNHELIEDHGQLFLQRRHQAATQEFGSEIGVQLNDMKNWSAQVDSIQAKRWDELANRALDGDAEAARELSRMVGERQLQHPVTLRNTREMGRSTMTSEGDIVAQPLREGMSYVYYPTFKPADADAVFLAVDRNNSTGRKFLAQREQLGPNNVAAYESMGEGPLIAHSRFASTDPVEVRMLVKQIQDESAKAGRTVNVGMSRLELPEERIKDYYKGSQQASSHDYSLDYAEALNGNPIDLSGKLIETPATTRAMTQDEFITEYQRLDERTSAAEKVSDPKTWTAGERASLEAGDWEAFSVARGYTPDEIDDYRRFLELQHGSSAPGVEPWVAKDGTYYIAPEFAGGNDLKGMFARHAELGTTPHVAVPARLDPGVTLEDAARSHAELMNQTFDDLFTETGRVRHELTVEGALKGELDYIRAFNGPIPEKVVGPVLYVPQERSLVGKIANKGFDAAVTPLVNAVSRTPLYVNNAMRRVSLSEEMLRPILSDPNLVAGAADLAEKLKLKGGVDELYSKLRDVPTSRVDAQALVDEGKLSATWLKLSDEEWNLAHAFQKNEKIARHHIGSSAAEGALNDTIPYIDDHHVRSQFAEEARNLIPFWWAQEAFFRRWAGTLKHTPEAIRKAQLIMQGARHVGIIHKNEEGEDTFLIPGSNVMMQAIMKPVQMIFGDKFKLPVPVGIEGEVRMATPGFDAVGVPGFGPLVGVPLATARRVFPELGGIEKGLMGERGEGRNPLEHIFPSFATKIITAMGADPSRNSNDAQIASASIQAMQYLEANGHGLPDNATPREQQAFIDRTTHWARTMLVARAIFGWFDPAPTMLKIGEPEVAGEFQELMQNVGLEDAISEMVRRHPDATSQDMFSKHHDVRAYATFGSKSLSGAPLPATVEAENFMDNNKEFIDTYRLASAWMLPQSDEQDENVRSVRALQLELGLRGKKTPEEWYEDFKFSAAADVYFKSSESFQLARETLKSSKERATFDMQWKDWKTKYLAQHPIFADTIGDQTGVKRRNAVLEEMQRAFVDPHLPDFAHKNELKTLVDSYTGFKTTMSRYTGQRGTKITDVRKEMNARFAAWAKEYTTKHPEVRTFYQRVIFPDVDLSASEALKYDTELHGNAASAPRQTMSPTSSGTALNRYSMSTLEDEDQYAE